MSEFRTRLWKEAHSRQGASFFIGYPMKTILAILFSLALMFPAYAADYVFALSWSPTFCEYHHSDPQCRHPQQFVVHGLWPETQTNNCQRVRLNEDEIQEGLTIYPTAHLLFHEWIKHGACSGLTATEYFDLVKKVRNQIIVPSLDNVNDVEAAFLQANPNLPADALRIKYNQNGELAEVRVCLAKDLSYTSCD